MSRKKLSIRETILIVCTVSGSVVFYFCLMMMGIFLKKHMVGDFLMYGMFAMIMLLYVVLMAIFDLRDEVNSINKKLRRLKK